ncbi:MAG: cupin domain-containing protein [bacterium]
MYTSDSGDTTEVAPGTIAFFPKGWRGTCIVSDTVRKVYMIR